MEGANETSINTNPPIYTCEVGMREEEGIKRKKKHWNRDGMEFLTKLKNNI